MQTSAFQLAGTNVRCNALCPGLIETGMTQQLWENARKRGTEARIGHINPLKRGGAADEIARVALFLASDECVRLLGGRGDGWANGWQELVRERAVLGGRWRAEWEPPRGAGQDCVGDSSLGRIAG